MTCAPYEDSPGAKSVGARKGKGTVAGNGAGMRVEDGGRQVGAMNERCDEVFVGDEIRGVAGAFDTSGMATGAPGLPRRFVWRGTAYTVGQVLESFKSSSPCKSGAKEVYLRKHWYRIRTTSGEVMTLYFNRQPHRGRKATRDRWVLYSMVERQAGSQDSKREGSRKPGSAQSGQ
jgi:hypothetical protein